MGPCFRAACLLMRFFLSWVQNVSSNMFSYVFLVVVYLLSLQAWFKCWSNSGYIMSLFSCFLALTRPQYCLKRGTVDHRSGETCLLEKSEDLSQFYGSDTTEAVFHPCVLLSLIFCKFQWIACKSTAYAGSKMRVHRTFCERPVPTHIFIVFAKVWRTIH